MAPDLGASGQESIELAVGERRIGEQGDDRGLQREAHAHLRHHVLFAREVEIGLDGRGAEHHVEAAGSDFRHIAGHDRVAAFRHRRRLGEPPFGAHAERQKADAERLGDEPASGQMAIKLVSGRVRVVKRRARKLKLSSGLERDGAPPRASKRPIKLSRSSMPSQPRWARMPSSSARIPRSPP